MCQRAEFNHHPQVFSRPQCQTPPLIETIPGKQYVIGRISTLKRHNMYNCPSRFRTLNLPENGPLSLRWSIKLNDMFITCAATEGDRVSVKDATLKFPVRMVFDGKVDLCTSRRAANNVHDSRTRTRPTRFKQIDHASNETVSYSPAAYYKTFGLDDYSNVAGEYDDHNQHMNPSVTVREICLLLFVFGYNMYEYIGREAPTDTTYFFSPKPIPPHPDYLSIRCFAKPGKYT
jgi:hypothetical protein